jgi:hypothetical protein
MFTESATLITPSLGSFYLFQPIFLRTIYRKQFIAETESELKILMIFHFMASLNENSQSKWFKLRTDSCLYRKIETKRKNPWPCRKSGMHRNFFEKNNNLNSHSPFYGRSNNK